MQRYSEFSEIIDMDFLYHFPKWIFPNCQIVLLHIKCDVNCMNITTVKNVKHHSYFKTCTALDAILSIEQWKIVIHLFTFLISFLI